ncbi:PIN domain-containing protein [Halochromatium glycolicum]|jgi:predicted nucleic acid-binding protein|uniref:VapC toxin family PIN domain ribonuclease n=1 Tax=Halochromatium glycolicum TaxID=85075 RepID=A0AAJ0U591_9GAMM|nr:PIN domain-containing protein [Halochromatium glycolicum]MBK1705510.1 VapC toxin family PIN domain ribonuclease [Halochromatium glycolicum]
MSVEAFLDTNILVYHLDDADPTKHRVAERLVRSALETGNACISFQVVQECLNVGLRKARVPLDADTARRYLDTVLIPLWRVMPSDRLYHRGIELQARYGYGLYDSLIIAAAQEMSSSTLFSEDLQHGQVIDGLTITNPFLPGGAH